MIGNIETILRNKFDQCPLFSRYLGPSLSQKINTHYWFENRLIRSIVRNTGWVEEHEKLLAEAEINRVRNSDQIFDILSGNDPFYDLKLFDALAEVRLIRWARQNGYADIEKLSTSYEKMPDFLMKKGEESIIAEAKHFRERDYIPEFIEDWLSGLVMTTGLLSRFGISFRMTDKYRQIRKELLDSRRKLELEYRQKVRDELSRDWLKKTEIYFDDNHDQELTVIDGLFIVRRSDAPYDTGFITSFADTSPIVMFDKLKGNLFSSLEQIRSYIAATGLKRMPSKAIVFISGTSPWQFEWDNLWETLSTSNAPVLIEIVKKAYEEAAKLLGIPFELVVGKDNPLRYVPFPWPD